MARLQNLVIQKLEELWKDPTDSDTEPFKPEDWLTYLYEHTNAGNPLIKFVVDRFAFDSGVERAARIKQMGMEMPRVFLLELVLVYAEGLNSARIFEDVPAGTVVEYTLDRVLRCHLVSEDV